MIPRTITKIQVIFVERGFFWCTLKTDTARDAKEIKTFRKFLDLFIFRHVFSRLREKDCLSIIGKSQKTFLKQMESKQNVQNCKRFVP